MLPPAPSVLYTINACSINPLPNPAFPCSPVLDASQAGYPKWLRETYYHDFDPRAGIAWRPFGNDKTVFRAGFGLFTVPSLGWEAYMMTGVAVTNAPFYVNSFVNGQPLFRLPADRLRQRRPDSALVGSFNVFEARIDITKIPQSAQWNVTIERQFLSSLDCARQLHRRKHLSPANERGSRINVMRLPTDPASYPIPSTT